MTTSTVSQTSTKGTEKDEKPADTMVEFEGKEYIYRPCMEYHKAHAEHTWFSHVKQHTVYCSGEQMASNVYSEITGFKASTWVPKKKHNYVDTVKDNGFPWRVDYSAPMTVTEARAIAYHMHKDDKDKSGEPYKLHLHAVEQGVIVLGGNDEERIAALFHDAVEDGHTTFDHLKEIGCTEHTVEIIEAVSKRHSEEQSKYLARIIAQGHGACRVKVADLLHNTRHDRMEQVAKVKGTYTRDRLLKKYRPALASLMLELTLIVDEDEQKKLATKPIGSSTGYYSGSGKSSTGTKTPTGSSSGYSATPMSMSVKSLIIGDWVENWSAPVAHAQHGNGISTFTLANGTVTMEPWMSGTTDRKVRVYSFAQWSTSTACEPTKGVHDDHYLDFIGIVEDAKEYNRESGKTSEVASDPWAADEDFWGGWTGL